MPVRQSRIAVALLDEIESTRSYWSMREWTPSRVGTQPEDDGHAIPERRPTRDSSRTAVDWG